MGYPKKISLWKVNTLEDAIVPQEERFPSGMEIGPGLMWEFNSPEIGKAFHLHTDKLYFNFKTSPINSIVEETPDHIIFETWNSTYKIKIYES